jgi:hypothetical protein
MNIFKGLLSWQNFFDKSNDNKEDDILKILEEYLAFRKSVERINLYPTTINEGEAILNIRPLPSNITDQDKKNADL